MPNQGVKVAVVSRLSHYVVTWLILLICIMRWNREFKSLCPDHVGKKRQGTSKVVRRC